MTAITRDKPFVLDNPHDAHVWTKHEHEQREVWDGLKEQEREAWEQRWADNDRALQDALSPPPPSRVEPAPFTVTPEPVAPSASDAPAMNPLPVATGNIAHAFDGLRRWNEQAWKNNLGSPSKWLRACIVFRGQQGVSETRWNPVLIGAALVRDGHAKQNSVRARFQTKPQLKDWKEAWKTYEADNFDTQ